MYKPNSNGIWWYNDNDGTWRLTGSTWADFLELSKEIKEGMYSNDDMFYLVFGNKRWLICDGLNPLEEHRIPKLKEFIEKNL